MVRHGVRVKNITWLNSKSLDRKKKSQTTLNIKHIP